MVTIPKSRSPSLTIKQENFVQGLFNGLTQREAYKRSYNCQKMKDKTIDERASVLFKNDKVRARYEELMDEHAKKALWTKEQSVRELLWIKDKSKDDIEENGLKKANSDAFLNAIKELNLVERIHLDSNEQEKLLKIKSMSLDVERKEFELNNIRKTGQTTEDKLLGYLDKLEGAFKNES